MFTLTPVINERITGVFFLLAPLIASIAITLVLKRAQEDLVSSEQISDRCMITASLLS